MTVASELDPFVQRLTASYASVPPTLRGVRIVFSADDTGDSATVFCADNAAFVEDGRQQNPLIPTLRVTASLAVLQRFVKTGILDDLRVAGPKKLADLLTIATPTSGSALDVRFGSRGPKHD